MLLTVLLWKCFLIQVSTYYVSIESCLLVRSLLRNLVNCDMSSQNICRKLSKNEVNLGRNDTLCSKVTTLSVAAVALAAFSHNGFKFCLNSTPNAK